MEKVYEEVRGVNYGECYFLIKLCYVCFLVGCML